jgi:sulfate adenylyltransferase large subunit
MLAPSMIDDDAFEAFLQQQEHKSLLRFIACGSVDHGKSSLLGRLLYEAKLVLDDQLETLAADTRKHGTSGGDLDFSLLLDGLAAEREQKITIDIAYRFFTTDRRKFIVADAPGHEQYTRNMATGASTADLALLLVNAEDGLTRQTLRHSLIVSMLGVRHLVVAINKMDLIGWSQQGFDAIARAYRDFAKGLDIDEVDFNPPSAREGDNVDPRSHHMDWYDGPTVLEYLEQVDIAPRAERGPLRMPVQWINRPDPDFRGYCGTIAGGEVRTGMPVMVAPSGQRSRIARIVTAAGDIDHAISGQAVTLTLQDNIDVSRGAVIAAVEQPPLVTSLINARILWMGNDTFLPGRRFLVKVGTATAAATVAAVPEVIDLDTFSEKATDRLNSNEIGRAVLRLDRAIAVDRYADNRDMGGLILIDPESNDTVALGLVDAGDGAVSGGTISAETPTASVNRSTAADALLSGSATDIPVRSLLKAVTWRVIGSLATFIIAYLITSSVVIAGSVVAAEVLFKIAFYYFHERIWSAVRWGRRSAGDGQD